MAFLIGWRRAMLVLGWALSHNGDTGRGLALLKDGLQAYQANGAVVGRPYFLGLLASAI